MENEKKYVRVGPLLHWKEMKKKEINLYRCCISNDNTLNNIILRLFKQETHIEPTSPDVPL